MRFLISGYYGFNNAGDEAVLAAVLEGLQRRFPGSEAQVLSGAPEVTRRLHGVEARPRWSARAIWRALGEADLLLQGGGGLLQDATSRASSVYYLGILRLSRLRRVPAVILAQGVGPLRTPALRRLTRREFSHAAAVTVRDQRSVDELAAMGLRQPAPVLTADPALLLQPRPAEAQQRLQELGLAPEAPRLVLAPRAWPGARSELRALRAEAAFSAWRGLAEEAGPRLGLEVLVLPFQEPDDLALAAAVADGLPHAHLLSGVGHPGELVAHVAGARLVVAMRLHGLIFAAAQAVPAVGVSYDPKVAAFGERAGQTVLALGDCRPERLLAEAERALAEADGDAQRRRSVAEALKAQAEGTFEVLAGVARSR